MTPLPAIELEGISKRFGDRVVVDRLDLAVEAGQVCGLLGPNGAGKTTALRMLVGLVRPTSGEARVLGERIEPGAAVLARVGSMIEHAAFVPHLTGRDNLRLYWEAGGVRFDDALAEDGLTVAGLGDALDRKVKTYSQGMRQRLGIARALLGRPEVLVLDEPTNGLDPGEMRQIRDLLERFTSGGGAVLLSSHLLGEVEQVCSQVVVLNQGRLVASGKTSELVETSHAAYVEVDDGVLGAEVLGRLDGVRAVREEGGGLEVDLDGIARSDLVDALVGAGLKVRTITARHGLEDAFLGLLDAERR